MNVLVVACHPDDESLGVGGTIAKLTKRGHKVTLAIVTRCAGDLNRYTEIDPTSRRREEARHAALVLGIQPNIYFGEFPEMRLSQKLVSDMAWFITQISKLIQPEIVFCHHWSDLNQDHRTVAEATMVAVRPHTTPWMRRMLAFMIDPVDWKGSVPARPTVYEDVSETLDAKLAALGCYKSEMLEYPHPRSLAAVEVAMRANGVKVGRNAAEVFELVWEVSE